MRRVVFTGLAAVLLASLPATAWAIPAWARKYNMNCNGCHAPAAPRLNAKGFAFKWAGYRMPEEIGEKQEVKNVGDVLAARLRFQYAWNESENSSPSKSQFQLSDATLFAGGSFGKNYGAFMEYEHAAGGTELVNHVMGVWGKEDSYIGVRTGQMHWLLRGAVAGFDRPTGLSTPTPLSGKLTSALPFKFSTDQLGLEAFWVSGKNRLSGEILNGVDPAGHGDEVFGLTKDFVLIDQLLYDETGSGLTAVAYFGSVTGADPKASDVTSNYSRFAISANKIFGHSEVMAGYAFGKDSDLPVLGGSSLFKTSSVTGNGFWLYGGYTLPTNNMTLFSRYEFVNPNTDATNAGNTRFMVGTVLPISLPEYLRWSAEYTLDMPRPSGSLKKHGFVTELMLNF